MKITSLTLAITVTPLILLTQGCATTDGSRNSIWEKTETQEELQAACGKVAGGRQMLVIPKPKPLSSFRPRRQELVWKWMSLSSDNLRCNGWGSASDIASAKATAKSMKLWNLCYEVHAQQKMIDNADMHGINSSHARKELKIMMAEATRRGGFSSKDKRLIAKHDYAIGMKESALLCSRGVPERTNRSTGSWGTHTQYVYDYGLYIYAENGRVTSWQN